MYLTKHNRYIFILAVLLVTCSTLKSQQTNAAKEPAGKSNVVYEKGTAFKYGVVKMSKAGIVTYINEQGQYLFNSYKEGSAYNRFAESKLEVVKKGKLFGAVNSLGEMVVPVLYEELHYITYGKKQQNYCFKAMQKGMMGLIDSSGVRLLDFIYDHIEADYSASKYNLLFIEKNGLKGVFDMVKKRVVAEPVYDQVSFNQGDENIRPSVLDVEKNGKKGMININGTEVLKPVYNSIYRYRQNLIIVNTSGKMYAADSSGKLITGGEYENMSVEGDLLKVSKAGKYGLLNMVTGKIVLPLDYTDINVSDNGIFAAPVISIPNPETVNGQVDDAGLQNGAVSVSSKDQTVFRKEPLMYRVKKTKYGLVDAKGQILLPAEYDEISMSRKNVVCVKKNNKWGIITVSGTVLLPLQYSYCEWLEYSNTDPLSDVIIVKQGNLTGWFNCKNNRFISPSYETVTKSYGSSDCDINKLVLKKGDKQMLADLDGNITDGITIKVNVAANNEIKEVEAAGQPSDDYLFSSKYPGIKRLNQNGKTGLYNCDGKELLPPVYETIDSYFSGFTLEDGKLLRLVKDYSSFGVANAKGRIIYPPVYNDILYVGSSRLLLCKKDSVFLADFYGNILTILYTGYEAERIDNRNFNGFYHNRMAVKKNGMIGFIDTAAREVIPPVYTEADNYFNNGYTIVKQNDVWGVINRNGQILLAPAYERLIGYDSTHAIVAVNNKAGYIVYGKGMVLPAEYDYIELSTPSVNGVVSFKDQFLILQKDNLYGIADATGKILAPVIYSGINMLNDQELIEISKESKKGIMDKNGIWILQPVYDHIIFAKNKSKEFIWPVLVAENNKWKYINQKGETISFSVKEVDFY